MEAIVAQLKRSPRLKLVVDELAETLRLEAAARQRFRDTLEDGKRREFINGEVIEHMTARQKHMMAVHLISKLMSTYVSVHKLGTVLVEQMLIETTRNDYGPDICFWTAARAVGFGGDQVVFPPPDLICEVLSPSTARNDRGVKFEDFAGHGVREYWIVDPDARTIEQYLLKGDAYELAVKVRDGSVRSEAIEGFELPVAAAFDDQANLEALWKLAPRR